MLRDDIKVSLRISHTALDDDIDRLTDECFAELERVGVAVPNGEDVLPLQRAAAELYVKWHYDWLNKGEQFRSGFESLRDALALSSAYRSDGDV